MRRVLLRFSHRNDCLQELELKKDLKYLANENDSADGIFEKKNREKYTLIRVSRLTMVPGDLNLITELSCKNVKTFCSSLFKLIINNSKNACSKFAIKT